MQYVILIFLIVETIILVYSMIKDYNAGKQKVKELNNTLDVKLADLKKKIGYADDIKKADDIDIQQDEKSLLAACKELVEEVEELKSCYYACTESYINDINKLIDELTVTVEKYNALQVELEKNKLVLSIVLSVLDEEQVSTADKLIAEKVKELEELEQQLSEAQQDFTEDFEQGITPKLV